MINKHISPFLIVFFTSLTINDQVSKSDILEDKSNRIVNNHEERSSSVDDYLRSLESLALKIRFLEEEIARFKKPFDESCTQCSTYNYKVSLPPRSHVLSAPENQLVSSDEHHL